MKKGKTATEREAFWCEKTQSLTLKISTELVGVLLWVNKFSTVLIKLVQ